jgi:NAD-dependent deacetylase
VWEWYRDRLVAGGEVEPHAGYEALMRLQNAKGSMPVITQNVDGLHQKAGHNDVIELHGTLLTASCIDGCGARVELSAELLDELPPACACGSWLRPDVVLFGEPLPYEPYARALALAETCDIMLVIGTSMVVYPAAGIPYAAISAGACIIEVNPEETDFTGVQGVITLKGAAGIILPGLIGEL